VQQGFNLDTKKKDYGLHIRIGQKVVENPRFWSVVSKIRVPLTFIFENCNLDQASGKRVTRVAKLRGVHLTPTARYDDGFIKHLAHAHDLWSLEVHSGEFDFTLLGDLQGLQRICTVKQRLSVEELKWLSGRQHLEYLELREASFAPGDLANLKGCTELRSIVLHRVEVLTEKDGLILENLRELVAIDVTYVHFQEDFFRHLPADNKLAWVNAGYSNMTDEHLATLSRCRNLEWLTFRSAKVTDRGLEAIGELPITVIDISETTITGAGLAKWKKRSPDAEPMLFIAYKSKFDDVGLSHLLQLGSISKLDIAGTNVSAKGVRSLSALKELREVGLAGLPLKVEHIMRLKAINDRLRVVLEPYCLGTSRPYVPARFLLDQ